jgi:hypothetical protein
VTSKSETIKVGNATLTRTGREQWSGKLGSLDFFISKEYYGHVRPKFYGHVDIIGLPGCRSLVESQDNTLKKVVASLNKKMTKIHADLNGVVSGRS